MGLFAAALLFGGPPAWLGIGEARAQEVCGPAVDCDLDGFSAIQGDCDEADPAVFPGSEERCDNDRDDDCDRLVNEGCDRAAQQGQLSGGSTCEGGGVEGLAVLAVPLLWRRRREAHG